MLTYDSWLVHLMADATLAGQDQVIRQTPEGQLIASYWRGVNPDMASLQRDAERLKRAA